MKDGIANNVMKVIHDHFSEDPEVYEIAKYINASLTIDMMISIGIMGNQTQISLPPEALLQVKRIDTGLTRNDFYTTNYAALRTMLALSDIKFDTMNEYLAAIAQRKVEVALLLPHIKAVLYSQFDALSILALVWKGREFASQFDRKLRQCVGMTAEQEIFFEKLETGNF